jgi:peptidoglycan/LPS O-acetylase OafA/YrhL
MRNEIGKSEFNKNIMGLRGICSLLVVLHHMYNGPKNDGWFEVSDVGAEPIGDFMIFSLRSAVDVFFMISGFLMIPALYRSNSISKFALNRFIRIYPAFIATTGLVLIVGPIIHYKYLSGVNFSNWLYYATLNLFMLPGIFPIEAANVVAWSLSYEAAFYVVVALVFVAGRRYDSRTAVVVGVCLIAGSIAIFPSACSFLVGAIVYKLSDRRKSWSIKVPDSLLLPLTGCFFGLTELARQSVGISVYGLYGAAFFFGIGLFQIIATTSGPGTALLRLPLVQYLGMISYSLYLWHPMVMFATKRVTLALIPEASPVEKVLFLATISALPIIAVSHLSHRFIEIRGANFVRRILDRRRRSIRFAET